jgi:geranylgeranylglycerol-phosphate geranylgeranyltransferase
VGASALDRNATVIEGRPPSRAVHPYLRLVRVGNVAVSFVGTVVGGLAARGLGISLGPLTGVDLLLAAGSTACVTAAGNTLNDYLDRESDRVNHPDRPLVLGQIRPDRARGLAAFLLVASALLIAPVLPAAPLLGLLLALAIGALLAYELRWKSEGVAGNLLVALLTGLVFIYGGAAVGAPLPVLPFAAMAFLATLSREIIKDMEDAAGDLDRRTLPRLRGMGTAAVVARGAVLGAILLSPIPILTYLVPSLAVRVTYGAIVAVADGIFVASVLRLPNDLHREQSLSKGAMTVALLAFLATAFR